MDRPTPGTVLDGTPDWTASSRADLDRVFRSATRHSVRVRLLRIAVPVGVAVAVAALGLAAWFNPLRLLKLPNATGTLGISGTKITMELPRLSGFTRDQRAYELTARTADQDLTRPDAVELKGIEARVQMQDRTTVEMSAATGLYNTKADVVTLGDDVRLKSSSGYEARMSDAVIDMHSGNIASQQPVEVKLLNGVLNAKRFEVVESGDLVRFDGGIDMIMKLTGGAGGPASEGVPSR